MVTSKTIYPLLKTLIFIFHCSTKIFYRRSKFNPILWRTKSKLKKNKTCILTLQNWIGQLIFNNCHQILNLKLKTLKYNFYCKVSHYIVHLTRVGERRHLRSSISIFAIFDFFLLIWDCDLRGFGTHLLFVFIEILVVPFWEEMWWRWQKKW